MRHQPDDSAASSASRLSAKTLFPVNNLEPVAPKGIVLMSLQRFEKLIALKAAEREKPR